MLQLLCCLNRVIGSCHTCALCAVWHVPVQGPLDLRSQLCSAYSSYVVVCRQARPRKTTDSIVTRWLIVRYMVVGAYVGLATAAGFVWFYLMSPVRL